MIFGIDVSRYEEIESWSKIKGSGYLFAAMRATVGDYYTDPTLSKYWDGSGAVGIVRTAYHVIAPERPVLAQMDRFAKAVVQFKRELPWVLDVELDRGQTNANIINRTKACLQYMEDMSGRRPLFYTNWNFINSHFTPVPSWVSDYDLWVANYTIKPDPLLPVGWKKWKIWQYSESGIVPGVANESKTDLDLFNGTLQELMEYAGVSTPVDVPSGVVQRLEVLEREARAHGWNIP